MRRSFVQASGRLHLLCMEAALFFLEEQQEKSCSFFSVCMCVVLLPRCFSFPVVYWEQGAPLGLSIAQTQLHVSFVATTPQTSEVRGSHT